MNHCDLCDDHAPHWRWWANCPRCADYCQGHALCNGHAALAGPLRSG